MLQILQNVPLALHSTMRLGGKSAYVTDVHDKFEVEEAVKWSKSHNLPLIMVGSGSNIIWRDEGFNGLLVVNRIKGVEVSPKNGEFLLRIGAGEIWDSVVELSAKKGLSGVEALSLIPGTAGATPVQNVGAYGQEISQTLIDIEAYDTRELKFVTVTNTDCEFGYRTSRFKTKDHGRFLITFINLKLSKNHMKPPFYAVLQNHLGRYNIHDFSPINIRKAVIEIRRSKLPDPAEVANNGSFFANPVVSEEIFKHLQTGNPSLAFWAAGNNKFKLSAAWLVEQTGFKNYHDEETGMATWAGQPLVFVNEHAKNTKDLLKFRQKILDAVQEKYAIKLEQEPELLP